MLVGTEPVTRLRPVVIGTDRYGNPVYADNPAEEELPPALFAPAGAVENVATGRFSSTDRPHVYWPRQWPDVQHTDQLRVRGDVYDVDGKPADWRLNDFGGLVVPLTLTEG